MTEAIDNKPETQQQIAKKSFKRDFLWPVLFLIIFVNGFESGGYQASLLAIGESFDLTITTMGIYAAVELFADMLAPILLGSWADRVGKDKSIKIMLVCQIAITILVWFALTKELFVAGIFLLGLTTSALQFMAIALVADAYPASGKRKIGYITSMYAFGALTAPLIVSFYFGLGFSWHTLFAMLAIGSAIALVGILRTGASIREAEPQDKSEGARSGKLIIPAVLLLCIVMCIYVGFENGFAFFVDTLFTNVYMVSTGKFALSLYWAVMIPSRILVGHFAQHSSKILTGSLIAIPCVTTLIAFSPDSTLALLLCVPLGFASGAIYPCVLTIMLPFAGKKTATATGMITAATGIGGFAFTALTGFMADQIGMQSAMLVLAAFFILSLLAVYMIRRYK